MSPICLVRPRANIQQWNYKHNLAVIKGSEAIWDVKDEIEKDLK